MSRMSELALELDELKEHLRRAPQGISMMEKSAWLIGNAQA